MAKLPIDDILKAIAKQMANKGNKKARYELMKKTKNVATSGASKVSAKPKVKPKPKGATTVSGKPIGRIAATKPTRPKRDYYAKGKSVAQTDSEKRAAERMANRMLKKSGSNQPKAGPTGSAKPVDVRGSIIKPPSKATMRPPSARGSKAYEADKSKAEIAADRLKFGRGQKPPKPPKKDGGSGVVPKPKPKNPSGSGGAAASVKRKQAPVSNTKEAVKARRAASAASETQKRIEEIKRIRSNIAAAKSPDKKAKFEQQLRNLVIKTASDRVKGKGKYANTRPLGNR